MARCLLDKERGKQESTVCYDACCRADCAECTHALSLAWQHLRLRLVLNVRMMPVAPESAHTSNIERTPAIGSFDQESTSSMYNGNGSVGNLSFVVSRQTRNLRQARSA